VENTCISPSRITLKGSTQRVESAAGPPSVRQWSNLVGNVLGILVVGSSVVVGRLVVVGRRVLCGVGRRVGLGVGILVGFFVVGMCDGACDVGCFEDTGLYVSADAGVSTAGGMVGLTMCMVICQAWYGKPPSNQSMQLCKAPFAKCRARGLQGTPRKV